MLNRATFNALEAQAEASELEALSPAIKADATAALALISESIQASFDCLKSGRVAFDPLEGFKLAASDPCERVAEALAAWIVESDPERFFYAPGGRQDRYSVTTLETCADGFERLRSWREFILCAYVSPCEDTTPEELGEQWERDIQAVMRPESFDYARASHCVRAFVADNRSRLDSELRAIPMAPEGEEEEGEFVCFRLYIEDSQAGERGGDPNYS